ncbi:hypothetical protein [Streptomyces sp. st170]|uniref:hypothetical protein n=1 Tax=Streptomyces sp. st170 TaxID=1828058 RepID=UPI001180AE78|nr:hypothetical protein [Streptomyces sp. st170]
MSHDHASWPVAVPSSAVVRAARCGWTTARTGGEGFAIRGSNYELPSHAVRSAAIGIVIATWHHDRHE